ncbi:MAG: permease-like cell division protein FtsX [Candidatus Gastranaerophilaceae bacterium]|jgi:cell division transport system permease protein
MQFGIAKELVTEARIVIRILIETIKAMKQTGWINVVIITTMAAILSIFGCLFRTSLGLSNFIDEMGTALEISVYVKPQASTQRLVHKIQKIDHIKNIKLITKEQAWDNMKSQMNMPKIRNPLPDTLHIKVNNQMYVEDVAKEIKSFSGVEDVRYARDIAQKIQLVSNIGNIVMLVVMLVLGSLTIFIISNTIHLAIQSKKNEIEIMQLMGVTSWYIKAPFIIQGGIYGLSGALLALIPLNILQIYLNKANIFFGIPMDTMSIQVVMLSLFSMGIIFGAGGSILSVKKYLNA